MSTSDTTVFRREKWTEAWTEEGEMGVLKVWRELMPD